MNSLVHRSGSSSEGMSLGPQCEEGGVKGIVGVWLVVPGEVWVHLEDGPPHLLLSCLWNGSQDLLQLLHL